MIEKKIKALRNSAKQRRIKLNLNSKEYEALINLGCQYCGQELINSGGHSLDRVDSNKGYYADNVVPCCKTCNIAKNNMTVIEFITWINKVHAKTTKDIEEFRESMNNNFNYKEAKKQLDFSSGIRIKY